MSAQADRADELGDLVNGHPEHVLAALPELEAIVGQPEDTAALIAAIEALGHAWDSRAAAVLMRHVPHDHPDADVRLALAQSLACGVDDEDPEFDPVARTYVQLSVDVRDEVRDWACFGLGSLEVDTPAVRDALAARLSDPDAGTRCEALVALAALRDGRALAACRRALDVDPDDVWLLELRAAAALADPLLLPSLERLRRSWENDAPDDFTAPLAEAIRSCSTAPNR